MSCKLYRLLCCALLLFVLALPVSAQNAKQVLLKHIDSIALPPLPGGTSTFITVNERPEIIATVRFDFWNHQYFRLNAIMSSTLGKGQLLLIGPSAYFKAVMLADKNVQQLLKNALVWAKHGNKTRKVAMVDGLDKPFRQFISKQNASVYIIKNFQFKKNTDVLILNKDVADPLQLKRLEDFITAGGTLLFASPHSDMYLGRDSTQKLPVGDLNINKLFAKAGMVNPTVMVTQAPETKALLTDSVPDYLHITTILPRLLLQNKTAYDENADFLAAKTMEAVFKYNPPDAAIFNQIKHYFKMPVTPPVPTIKSPLHLNTPQLRIAANVGYRIYQKQQDFKNHPEAKGLGYQFFPGDVPKGAVRVNETVTIPVKVGTQGLHDMLPGYYRPHSTGLYIPAGERVSITLNRDLLKLHLKAQIGVHDDELEELDELKRVGVDMTSTFELDKETTQVYSPYGGLLLINIGDSCALKTISIKVNGAVKAPYFKLGETSEQDWNATIRNNPAPWAELATDNIVLTVPSYRIRNLSNPVKLMQFWDEVMDADADLAIISRKRVHQERIIVDVDVAYGYMFTQLYKMVVPDDQSCEWMLNEAFIRSHGSWGTFHEIGHRHQFADLGFPGTGEVTVNLFTMYVYDKVLHKGIYQHEGMMSMPEVIAKIRAYLADNPSYEKWSDDPFLALSMYIQIIDHFGWDAIKTANTAYRNLPKDKYPKTDQGKRDLWFTTISKATNSNMARFFEVWKIPVSDEAKKEVSIYPEWFPAELGGFK